MEQKDTTKAASETSGHLLVFVGFVLLIISLTIGNVLMAERFLSNFGLGILAQNSSAMLWAGIASIVAGAFVVVTSGVDVDVE